MLGKNSPLLNLSVYLQEKPSNEVQMNEKKIWEYDVLDGETFGEYEYAPDLPALRTLLLR